MMRKPLLFTLLLLLAAGWAYGQANGKEVMMQGFNWESHKSTYGWYNLVKDKGADLQASQIDVIWMPPASDAASDQGYLPRELYELNSKYGTQAQLQELIGELHSRNIKVLADIVINHRVGLTGWGDFTNPTWGCWAATSDDEWTSSCGNQDTGTPYAAARDVDHTNQIVRNDLKAWMNWLKTEIGFDGWRYDYVHGFGAGYIKEYNDATSPYFSVGELWDGDRQKIINWIDGTQGASTAFDFPLKYALHDAVSGNYARLNDGGKVPGLIGAWPEKSVTFIDNHDTGSTQNYDPFPGEHVMQGYAYILTHPGTPMVFWDHFYDWGHHDAIKALVKVRKDNGLSNTSTVSIQKSDGKGYAAIIDDKVAMKIGSGSWAPSGSGWTLRASGTNYAVWDKGTVVNEPTSTFTVHFKKPASWASAVKVHHWSAQPAGSLTDSAWPGINMETEGNGWYRFTFSDISATNLLFHDNNGNKTVDLNRGKEGWYMNGTWYDTNPEPGNSPPTLTVNPAGPYSSSTAFTITLTAQDDSGLAPTIYYTLDGSTPTSNSASAAGNTTIDVTASLTLKAFALDNQGATSTIQEHQYTINATNTSFTVYFQKPSNWNASVKIHHWGAQPTGSLNNSAWPGKDMEADGDNWYKFTFTDITSTNLLFHDNAGRKTADLTRDRDGWYYNGVWYDTDPRPKATGLTIHLYNTSWSTPTLYYWNLEPAGATANTNWPGIRMESEGNGWWKHTIPNANCTNLIFSNNGSNQTANLYRCGEGWYMNDNWYSSKPGTTARITATTDNSAQVEQLSLGQNYPNPARGTTTIPFALLQETEVSIKLYDKQGKAVSILLEGEMEAGRHQLELNTTDLAPGFYLYRIETGSRAISKKLIIAH